MGSTSEQPGTGLTHQLHSQPYAFDFFQAVRLLEHAARAERGSSAKEVGSDHEPGNEVVRFRALPSLTFPSGQISKLKAPKDDELRPTEMTVAFMGLTGPSGVLPRHYTSLLIERAHSRNKDRAMLEFFDLFNHRSISLFYRAWEKYRFPFAYERHQLSERSEEDLFSFCLFCLAGIGERGSRNRSSFDDEQLLFYGGHFAQRRRSATALRQILSDFTGADVEIQEFVGQWLYLEPENQTAMPSKRHPEGLNCALGASSVVGSRAWDVQSRFRISIGPLDRTEFNQLLPSEPQLKRVCELVRLYVGPEFDFDIQLILKKEHIPSAQLGATAAPRLGWNSWMQSGQFEDDAEDAVFRYAG